MCSVILGDDIVGRLGITTVFDLKVKLFHIIQNCDIGKVSRRLTFLARDAFLHQILCSYVVKAAAFWVLC